MPLKWTPRFLSPRAAQPVHLLGAAAVTPTAAAGIAGRPRASPPPWSLAKTGAVSRGLGLQGLRSVPVSTNEVLPAAPGLGQSPGW